MKRWQQNKNPSKKERIEIAYVVDSNLSILGGLEESVRILCRNLNNYFTIAVLQPGERLDAVEDVLSYFLTETMRLKELIKRPSKFIKYVHKLGKELQELRPRIIHTQSQASFFIVAFLKKMRVVSREAVLIHTERGLYTKYGNIVRLAFYMFLPYANLMITTTEHNKQLWSTALEARGISFPIKIIPNTAGEAYESINMERATKDRKFTVGFAGRYCKWKGWELAEEICKEVNDKCPQVSFKMIISCLDKSAESETLCMFERMRQRYKDRFYGAINIPANEMSNFYYDIDVFVLTSDPGTESFGRTLVEAMSRYTAVLSTDAGGAVEVVGNRENVLGTAKEFSDRIFELSQNPHMLNLEKLRGLKRIEEEYTLEKNIASHLDVYRSFLVEK